MVLRNGRICRFLYKSLNKYRTKWYVNKMLCYYTINMRKKDNMDLDKWLADAAKWILPFFGFLFIAKEIFGLYFSLGFAF